MKKKYKNKDLASKLGVSGTLVSLVLNNKADLHGIRKETQEKVLAMARQMGFFGSATENQDSLPVEDQPGVIGLITPSMNNSIITGIIPYLQKAFASLGLGFSLITRDLDDQRFDRLISAFRKFFSGLILVGEAADDYTIRTLKAAEYPFILLEKTVKTSRLNTVSSDLNHGYELIAGHVYSLGYKNIILAADRKLLHDDKNNLLQLENILEKKAAVDKSITLNLASKGNNEPDFSELDKLLRPPVRADLIITLKAPLVYPLMAHLNKRKIRVPQDVALISMEDGPGFDLMYPSVTCLRKTFPVMASKAAHMIWTEVKNGGKTKFKRQVNIPPDLIVRNSCGTLSN